MQAYVKLLSALSTVSLLGCSQLSAFLSPSRSDAVAAAPGRGGAAVQRSGPISSLSDPKVESDNLVRLGRAAHDKGELALAEARYAQALAKQPAHAGALNAIAVIYAQSGRFEQAVAAFERALALDPQAAHVHNNLGYALLLAGRLAEAESELERALALNPASALTQKNMALLAQAKERTAAAARSAGETAGPALVAVAPNVYELRDAAAPLAAPQALTAAAAATPPVRPQAALRGMRLEVSNGVGIRHLARRTGERLAPTGLVTARLTNQPGYRQQKTEIQYSEGHRDTAGALAGHLPLTPQLVAVKRLERNVQVRLVLGHDLAGKAIAAWAESAEEAVALIDPRAGWLWG